MAQQTFLLNNNEAEPLTLSWGFNWKNLKISYQGEPVGEFASKKELAEGQAFQLADNRNISVKLKGSFMPQLEVLINNEPIAGSATDPEAIIKGIYKLSLILGILNTLLGLAGIFLTNEFFQNLGFGIGNIITGAVIIALAFGIKKQSLAALIVSMSFWVLDYALSIFFAIQQQSNTNPGAGLYLRIFIVYSLYRGIGAMKQLKQREQAQIQAA